MVDIYWVLQRVCKRPSCRRVHKIGGMPHGSMQHAGASPAHCLHQDYVAREEGSGTDALPWRISEPCNRVCGEVTSIKMPQQVAYP